MNEELRISDCGLWNERALRLSEIRNPQSEIRNSIGGKL
jgi:hypothetical protein